MSIPPGAIQELGINLFCSVSFSLLNHPRHKITAALKVAGLVILAKTIETVILTTLKMTADYFYRFSRKTPEPIGWDIKLAASIASWGSIIYLRTWLTPHVHPRTFLIAILTSLPTIILRK